MDEYFLHRLLFKIAGTCLVLLIALGIDNLIFHIVDGWSEAAMPIATIGFIALVVGIFMSIWFNDI